MAAVAPRLVHEGLNYRMNPRSGGQILVDQLAIHGVSDVFCVPGESYLAVLDALHDADIRVTVCRQEGGATFMAEAAGKLTGRPGIAMVTRGPGATNASPGIHIAMQDSTPMVLFVGQVERNTKDREAFQELDYRAVFGSMAKWVIEIDDARRIPELVSRAFHIATQGRPGPVVVAIAEDMLTDMVEAVDAGPMRQARAHVGADEIAEVISRLDAAKNPFVIVGGSGWTEDAKISLEAFAQRFNLPVAVSFRRQALFSADHPCFAGDLGIGANPKLIAHIKASDLVLLIGTRLSEMPSQGYTLFDIPGTGERLIHVHPGAEELNRIYRTAQSILTRPDMFCAALKDTAPRRAPTWAATTAQAHQDYLEWSACAAIVIPGLLQMGAVVTYLQRELPNDTIICNGAGNYTSWVHRFWRFREFGTQLAPTCGSMGYGVPAAVAAQRLNPSRTVVSFAGDGCFMMNGQEFATAVQYKLPIIVVLIDNGMYGTIRMHQERKYPGRVIATDLTNPDFAALARAYGGHGETVINTEDFAPAFARATASGKPSIIHCLLTAEALTPTQSLSAIRAGGFADQKERTGS
jgi:acetolactate synthase I/II/III large subunit